MTSITGEKITSRCYYYVVRYNGTRKAFYKKQEALDYYAECGKQFIAQEKDELFPYERPINQVPAYKELHYM